MKKSRANGCLPTPVVFSPKQNCCSAENTLFSAQAIGKPSKMNVAAAAAAPDKICCLSNLFSAVLCNLNIRCSLPLLSSGSSNMVNFTETIAYSTSYVSASSLLHHTAACKNFTSPASHIGKFHQPERSCGLYYIIRK
ncbi:MAG: hypothetical protein E7056_01280 [Lentisphaerae bacterium]|nr:hypothetical protein [Lentisphaerota bacterium]